jgi:hypothetical protein
MPICQSKEYFMRSLSQSSFSSRSYYFIGSQRHGRRHSCSSEFASLLSESRISDEKEDDNLLIVSLSVIFLLLIQGGGYLPISAMGCHLLQLLSSLHNVVACCQLLNLLATSSTDCLSFGMGGSSKIQAGLGGSQVG